MKKYTVKTYNGGKVTSYKIIGENAKHETMTVDVIKVECDLKDKNSIMNHWVKRGLVAKPLESYVRLDTYVTDSEGNSYRRYDPTILEGTTRINFEWILEYTSENIEKLVNECIRLFENATGASATEVKAEKIRKYAKDHKLDIVTEIPDGYKETYWNGCPLGAKVLWNRKSVLKKEVKHVLLVERRYL